MGQWKFGGARKNGIVGVSVGALALLAQGQLGLASTGSSWSASPPNWDDSSSSSAPSSHRSVVSKDLQSNSVTPFSPGSNNLALDLGQVFLMGDLGSRYANSLGTQLHYTYGVSDLFGFDSSFGYSQHANGVFSMMTLLTGLRMNMSWYDKIIPYLVFGMGFYRPSYGDANPGVNPPSVSAILFGLHLGPGIDLELTKNLFFGASLTFHSMFGANETLTNGQGFNVGGSYTTFYIHGGVTF